MVYACKVLPVNELSDKGDRDYPLVQGPRDL